MSSSPAARNGVDDDVVRCPTCDARNRRDARWCSLCHVSFVTPAAAQPADGPPAVGTQRPGAVPGVSTTAPVGAPPPPPPAALLTGSASTAIDLPRPASRPTPTGDAGSSAFRRTDDGLEWVCLACDTWNAIEAAVCDGCGTGFGVSHDDGSPPAPVVTVSGPSLLVGAVALPGSGHWRLGHRGLGVGIMVIHLLFLLGGLSLLSAAGGDNRGVVAVAPLLLGDLALAVGSLRDTLTLRNGDRRLLLDSRVLLWMTVAVLGLVILLFLVTALSVPGGR